MQEEHEARQRNEIVQKQKAKVKLFKHFCKKYFF